METQLRAEKRFLDKRNWGLNALNIFVISCMGKFWSSQEQFATYSRIYRSRGNHFLNLSGMDFYLNTSKTFSPRINFYAGRGKVRGYN